MGDISSMQFSIDVLNGCSRGCSQWMYWMGIPVDVPIVTFPMGVPKCDVPNGCSHGKVPRTTGNGFAQECVCGQDFWFCTRSVWGPNWPKFASLLSLSLSPSLSPSRARRESALLCRKLVAICVLQFVQIGTTSTVMGVCGDATAACCALQQVPRAAALGLAGASGRTTLGTLGSAGGGGGGGGRQFGVRVSGSLLPHTLSRGGGGGGGGSSSSSRLGSSRRRESRRSWQTLMLAHLLKQLPCEVGRSAGGQVLVRAAGDSSSSGN